MSDRAPVTLDRLERVLAGRSQRRGRLGRLASESAVAVVLRERATAPPTPEVLLIRRAERAGDPWSGHMSFPGGRRQREDADLLAAAVRETHEEVGLDLGAAAHEARLVGRLSDVYTRAHGRPAPMRVRPFVFRLGGAEPPTWALSHEVAEALWVPLDLLADPRVRSTMPWRFAGVRWQVPCLDYEGRRIWGLTLMMVDELVYLARGEEAGAARWLRALRRNERAVARALAPRARAR